MRYTVVAFLESQEFVYRKVHFEFACELSQSVDSLASQYSPQYYTALDAFFRHARGEILVIFMSTEIQKRKKFLRFLFFSNGRGFDYYWHAPKAKVE